MLRILITLIILAGFCFQMEAQRVDYLFDNDKNRTWRDSGYYFVPELVFWNITSITLNPNGTVGATVVFRSTVMSELMYTGLAVFLYDPEDLPGMATLNVDDKGLATMLLPQDLLLCPTQETEDSMGLNDPYFPLFIPGRLDRIGPFIPADPIPILVQLNDFTVN
jgi:hypothetical protein